MTVRGIVLGTDNVPIPYANVIILGTRRGAQTDSTGVFRFDGIEPGTYEFRALALGVQAVTRSFTIQASANEPCTLAVNTLTAIGRGRGVRAPFTPIPDSLWKSLGNVVEGQTFRLNPQNGWRDPRRHGDEPSIGPYQIIKRGRDLTRSEATQVGEVLRDENSYWHPLVGEVKLCIPMYRHGLRLETEGGDTIECTICLSCSQLILHLNKGEVTWGQGFVTKEVKQWFARAFPESATEK